MSLPRPSRAAIAEGWPVLLTTIVVAATYGVIARQAGSSVLEASGSSLIIFAGAAQFATVGLLKDGATPIEVAVSVLLINLRHALMAASLRPFFTGTSLAQRLGLAYVLTDEAFAMSIGWFRRGHRDLSYYLTRPSGAVRHRLRDHRLLRCDRARRRRDVAEIGGAALTILMGLWRKNLLFAVLAGVPAVAGLRALGL